MGARGFAGPGNDEGTAAPRGRTRTPSGFEDEERPGSGRLPVTYTVHRESSLTEGAARVLAVSWDLRSRSTRSAAGIVVLELGQRPEIQAPGYPDPVVPAFWVRRTARTREPLGCARPPR